MVELLHLFAENGLKPVTVSPAMVVEPVKVAGPETVKVENVEVAAEKVPATLSDFKIDPPSLLAVPVKNEMPVRVDMTWRPL